MYSAFSLYPHGAFMTCESVAEFDLNARPPEVQPTVQKLELTARASPVDYDPIMHALTKLNQVYQPIIKPMLTTTYDVDDPYVTAERFDKLIGDISTIVNKIRCLVVKLSAMNAFYNNPNTTPVYDDFKPYTGHFMTRVDQIHQQGLDYNEYTYDVMPAFQNLYSTMELVSCIAANPELLDKPIFGSYISALLGDTGNNRSFVKQFDGFIDMMQCLFDDPGRMARLEMHETRKIYFEDLMRWCSAGQMDCNHPQFHEERKLNATLFCLMSHVCKDVSTCCYECICKLTSGENNINNECISECLQSVLMKSVNIFALGVAVIMTYATSMRVQIAYENGITSYTAMLLNVLKTA